jgi:Flp pilus assembly protein TadG
VTAPIPASREFHGPSRSRGLAAVEFVILAPFMLFLMVAGAELGRAFVQYQTLSYLVRHSARYVSENAISGTTGVVSISAQTLARARNLAVYGNIQGTGHPRLPLYQGSQVQVVDAGDDNIRVTATYPYQPMIGPVLPRFGVGQGSGPGTFNMQIAVTMRAIS